MPKEILHLSERTTYEGLPSLASLAREAAEARLVASVVLQDEDVANSPEDIRRRHDIAAALRTLRLTVDALKDGYQFNDAVAGAKVRAIEKAVVVLGREGAVWHDLLPKI